MLRRSYIGWLIALLVFLFLIFRMRTKAEAKTFREILNKSLAGSKYFKLSGYWYDIAKMETANFSSKLFIEANNPWGMKNPVRRQTTAVRDNPYISKSSAANRNDTSAFERLFKPLGWAQGAVKDIQPVKWARYASLKDAADDIVLYMDEFGYKTEYPTLLAFIQEMKNKGYFTESISEYYNKVKAWQGK